MANEADLNRAAAALTELIETRLNEPGRGIRIEDLLSAAGAVAGYWLIRACGDFDADAHDYNPGQFVISPKMNHMLNGDADAWERVPADSAFGVLRIGALGAGFPEAAFPPPDEAARHLLDNHNHGPAQDRFGRPPLTVADGHRPRRSPLQDGWILREPVNQLFERHAIEVELRAVVCLRAIIIMLGHVKHAIDPGVALRLTLETVNGMAKMAPMTPKRWAQRARPRTA